MRGIKLILFFIGFSVCINAWAQLSTNEKPVSFGRESEIRVCQRSAIPSVDFEGITRLASDGLKIDEKGKLETGTFWLCAQRKL